MKRLSFIFSLLLISLLGFLAVFPSEINAAGMQTRFFSNNQRNIIWEVGFKIISGYGTANQRTHSTLYRDWVTGTCQGWNRCSTMNVANLPGSPGYGIQWGTACYDPTVQGYQDTQGGNYNYVVLANITTHNHDDDLAWFSNNGGGRIEFGGLGNENNCPRRPPSCNCSDWNDQQCGGGSCGENRRLWTRYCPNNCADEAECRADDACIPRYGCSNGSCVRRDGGPYTSSTCGGDCQGPIAGRVYIDKNGDNNFDIGEGYENGTIERRPNGGNWGDPKNLDSLNQSTYRYSSLATGSEHDIRYTNYPYCRLNVESGNPKNNIRVPNEDVNFRLVYEKYPISGKVWFDADEDGEFSGDVPDGDVPYVNPVGKRVDLTVLEAYYEGGEEKYRCPLDFSTVNPNDRRCLDAQSDVDTARYVIPGNSTDLDGKKYVVRLTNQRSGHSVLEGWQKPAIIQCSGVNVDFLIGSEGNDVSGTIYEDDGDGILDPEGRQKGATFDKPYKGTRTKKARIKVMETTDFADADIGSGKYIIRGLSNGRYNINLLETSLRKGYTVISRNPRTVNIRGLSIKNVDFLVKPGPIGYSIEGNLFFNNPPLNTYTVPPDKDIPSVGNETVTITGGATETDFSEDGFLFEGLSPGTYVVRFSGVRPNYYVTYKPRGYRVTVGPTGCSAPFPASCVDGDVTNVVFGISELALQDPWFQGVGGDMRDDKASTVTIPQDKYFSIANANLTSPGVIFNFNVNRKSTKNWFVTSQFSGKSIKTSYSYVSAALKKGKANLLNPCGSSANCNLENNLAEGYYFIDKNINLKTKANTFSNNKDYVFLVKGNLNINSDLDVPPGSSVMFVASGNIAVDEDVNQIEGIFSADGSFIVNSKETDDDTQLIVEGSIIANAAKGGGSFKNKRDLGPDNEDTPSVKIIFRPDFALNAPDLVRYSNYNFREAAPVGR